MKQKIILYIAVIAIFIGMGVTLLLNVNNSKENILNTTATRHEPFAYNIELKRDGHVSTQLIQPGSENKEHLQITSTLTGILNLKVIDDNNSRLLFGQFSQLHYQADQSVEDLFTQPFAFYINDNGSIELYEKNISYDTHAKNMLLQVLHYFQVVTASSSSDKQPLQWQTKEFDLIGEYIADYSVMENSGEHVIKKQKNNYLSINSLPGLFKSGGRSMQAQIIQHSSSFIINDITPLPTDVITLEQIKVKSGADFISDITTTFTAKATLVDPNINMPQSLAALEAQFLSRKQNIDLYATNPTLTALTAGQNQSELLSTFLQTYSSSPSEARQLIINYLRQYPEKSKAFVNMLYENRQQLSDEEEVRLWALLAKTGHKEAQEAYIYALTNPDFDQIIQYRAIGHIRFFKQPNAQFVEDLWQVQATLSNDVTGSYRDNKTLASAALLALGTLTTSDSIDTEVKNTILATLEDRLSNETNTMEVSALITAAGNTKNPELFDSITPYLQDDNEQLKEKAFMAIARIPGENSQTSLIEAYEKLQSSDQKLQFVALDSLNKMPITEASFSWVSNKVLQLNNPIESLGLIRILGNNVNASPIAESTFRNILAQNPSIEIKSEIYRFIGP